MKLKRIPSVGKKHGSAQKRIEEVEKPVLLERPAASRSIKAFEQAIRLFNRHDFIRAREAFETLVERFSGEAEVVSRARAYITICQQRLSHPAAPPRSADALYNRGVFELNRGQVLQAITCFERALKLEPTADHIIYALASAHARVGNVERALTELQQCIAVQENYRIQARRDPDFRSLFTNEGFQRLVGVELVE